MALDRYHLTKRKNDWRLEKAGSDRALVKAPTKAEAVKKMFEFVKLMYEAFCAIPELSERPGQHHRGACQGDGA